MTKRRVVAVMAAFGLALSGCAGGSGSPAPQSAATSAGSGTAATKTPSPTKKPTSSESSADVGTTASVGEWLAAVCTASKDVFGASETPNFTDAQKDPKKFAEDLKSTYKTLGAQLRAFAGRIERIGAPPTPNGKKFTDAYINLANKVADTFDGITSKIVVSTDPQKVFDSIAPAFQDQELQKQLKDFSLLFNDLETSEFKAVAKKTPECKGVVAG